MVGLDSAAGVVSGLADRIGAQAPVGEKAFGVVGGPVQTPFAGVLSTMVQQTQDLGKQADAAVTGLLNGQGVEVHDVMIAQQKADTSFELALQVRNKAVSAYQQLLGMQF
jgi:flagellar hook-basal body complex protein FliE